MKKTLPAISEQDIRDLTDRFGFELPEEYKAFLLRYGGGRPQNNVYRLYENDKLVWEFTVGVFYGVDKEKTFDLKTKYVRLKDRIPEELLAVVDDGVGNYVCIGVKGEYRDKVYLWKLDGQADIDEEPDFSNIDLLENSFNEFLTRLGPPTI